MPNRKIIIHEIMELLKLVDERELMMALAFVRALVHK